MQISIIITLRGINKGILLLVDDAGVALTEVIHASEFEDWGVPVTFFTSFPTLEADQAVIEAITWLEKEARGSLECSLLAHPQELINVMYGLDHWCEPLNQIVAFSK